VLQAPNAEQEEPLKAHGVVSAFNGKSFAIQFGTTHALPPTHGERLFNMVKIKS